MMASHLKMKFIQRAWCQSCNLWWNSTLHDKALKWRHAKWSFSPVSQFNKQNNNKNTRNNKQTKNQSGQVPHCKVRKELTSRIRIFWHSVFHSPHGLPYLISTLLIENKFTPCNERKAKTRLPLPRVGIGSGAHCLDLDSSSSGFPDLAFQVPGLEKDWRGRRCIPQGYRER